MRRSVSIFSGVVLAVSGGMTSAEAPKKPTFTEHVAPILYANCVQCHRDGDIAPMSLMSFEEVRPWAKSIQKAVESGAMPPWHADDGIGEFSNDRRLSGDDRDTIINWVKSGAKQGNPEDLPQAPEFGSDGWRLGEPDLALQFKEISLDGGGPDQFYDLKAETGLTEDTWIQSVEVRPSNRRVAHHVIVWQEGAGSQDRGWIGAWAAGMEPMQFPEGTGRLVTAGSSLIGDMHYHPADTPQLDQTTLGLYFAENNAVEKELVNLWVQNPTFKIPAGDANYVARANYTFPQDSYILTLLPHMHYRGKDFTYTARFPDGRKEQLLSVSKYDFNWQTGYELAEPLFVPKGTRIDCVAHWDNSADNPNNPDPTRDVTFGNESYDEMMIGFVDYIVKDGVRPPSSSDLMAAYAVELAEKNPGEVYQISIKDEEDGDEQHFVIRLPANGTAGSLRIGLQGTFLDVPIEELKWEGLHFVSVMSVMNQTFDLKGDVDAATGALTGFLQERGNDKNGGPVTGQRVN